MGDRALDRLPAGVGHPILGGWRDGAEVVTVMRDLGDAVLGWDSEVGRSTCRLILTAAASMDAAFAGRLPDGLCPLATRLSLFAPAGLRALRAERHPLVEQALRGWDRFADLVPADVADAVAAIRRDPGPLAAALAGRGTTVVHGDLWLVNVAVEPDGRVLIDWNLATEAPGAFDAATLLMGSSAVDAAPDDLLDDARSAAGEGHDETALRLALLAAVVDVMEQGDRRGRAHRRARPCPSGHGAALVDRSGPAGAGPRPRLSPIGLGAPSADEAARRPLVGGEGPEPELVEILGVARHGRRHPIAAHGGGLSSGMARVKNPDVGVLAGVELFQGLSKRELQKILSLMKELEYQAGEIVFAEGDPGGRFFLILEGTAKVRINGRTRATSGPGDYFGEMSLIDNSPRSATVTAETRLRTLALASFNFRPLLDEQPAITRKLLVETCGRLRTAQRSLVG